MTLLKRIEARLANPELNANFNREVAAEDNRRSYAMNELTYEEKNREQLRQIIETLTKVYNDDNTIENVIGGTLKRRYEDNGSILDFKIETNTFTIISRKECKKVE